MSLHYTVVFDNESNKYYAGQTLSGKVLVELDKPIKIKGLLYIIHGRSKVQWIETEGAGSCRRPVTYHAEEEYFKMIFYCLGGKKHNPFTLEAGSYSYPFSYVLSPTLPSSHEGAFGNIRYSATVILERPKQFDLKNKIPFTVLSSFDLRSFPAFLSPGKSNDEKYFCCWCCKKGPLTTVIMVPKTGYAPGETIPVIVELDNTSNVNIHDIKLKLRQITDFHAQHPTSKTRHQVKTMEKFSLGSLGARNSKTVSQSVLIPTLNATNITCAIVDSRYELTLKVETGSAHLDFLTSMPITIGTIPILEETTSGADSTEPAHPPNYETTMQATWDGNSDMPAYTSYDEKSSSKKHVTSKHNVDAHGSSVSNINRAFVPDV